MVLTGYIVNVFVMADDFYKTHIVNVFVMADDFYKTHFAACSLRARGSLSTQCRSWGGQYCRLSYNHRGKGPTEYVQDEVKQQVEQQLRNYEKYRALTQEWIDKAIQFAKMKVDMQKARKLKRR